MGRKKGLRRLRDEPARTRARCQENLEFRNISVEAALDTATMERDVHQNHGSRCEVAVHHRAGI